MAKSSVLIVTIGSNRKVRGGERSYNRSTSLCSLLPRHARDLIKRRRQIFDLLCGDEISRDGMLLRSLPYNVGLTDGPDLGGSASACYLPAIHRFRGRFYSELGTAGIQRLLESPHHLLILTGLYGLLPPEELIQAHSCHVLDHPNIPNSWTAGGFLTSLLLILCEKI